MVVDRVGYGKLVVAAFLFHVLSAFVTFAATKGQAQSTAYLFLYLGTFVFALANGTLEAVANPLVSTLFPNNRTHYLNILHASWPAGLVLGGLVGWILGEGMQVGWKLQLGLFLVPTLLYGIAFFGQSFPKSEASAKGLSVWTMLQEVGILGALVACVLIGLFFKDQLGSILSFFTGNAFFTSGTWSLIAWATAGILLLVVGREDEVLGRLAAAVRALRHARARRGRGARHGRLDPEHHRQHPHAGAGQDPVRVHVAADVHAAFLLRLHREAAEGHADRLAAGLRGARRGRAAGMVSRIETFAGAMFALAVYALGKTFFWPTMLAVVGDRFPRTGAVAMSIMGGIGMMSAGLIGGPGLGYAKDRFTAEHLQATAPAVYEQYKAPAPSRFLFLAEDHRPRRHEAVGGADGGREDAGAAAGGGRQHPRRPPRRWWRMPSFRRSWPSSICCFCSTSRRSAATSR